MECKIDYSALSAEFANSIDTISSAIYLMNFAFLIVGFVAGLFIATLLVKLDRIQKASFYGC